MLLAAGANTLSVVTVLIIALAHDLAVIDIEHAEADTFMRIKCTRHTLNVRELCQVDGLGTTLIELGSTLFSDVAFFIQDKLLCQSGIFQAFELRQPDLLWNFNHVFIPH